MRILAYPGHLCLQFETERGPERSRRIRQHTEELISTRKTSHKHNNKEQRANSFRLNSFMCTPASSELEIEGHMGPPVLMNIPLVEFVYLAFTRMPGKCYRRRLGSLLLRLCDGFRALINSLAC